MKLSDEQIQDLLRVGNPSSEECRLIRLGWDAAMRERTAMSAPEGWKLVPIVSTAEMDNAGADYCDGDWSAASAVWDAMLAAAPGDKS